MNNFRLMATAAFGLEGIVKDEVKDMGFKNIQVENGKVFFDATTQGLIEANLWLRTASKIYWVVGDFNATEFDELYNKVYALPWHEILDQTAEFPVYANSNKSELYSLSSIQSISKKAIVDKLKKEYAIDWFEETGSRYEIKVDIRKDRVLVGSNTTGEGLYKRGYRTENNKAPLRETLAAALVKITNWKPKIPLIDPMCGTGTIVIEAAMMGKNIAPGLNRPFLFEQWHQIDQQLIDQTKQSAREAKNDQTLQLFGYDIDRDTIAIAINNAERAGVLEEITFKQQAIKDLATDIEYGYLILNPPYGERMKSKKEINQFYYEMIGKLQSFETFSKYILTAYDKFEDLYGEKATKNRKLYNGSIQTYFYQYYGPRPPKNRL
jgi:putative N6-adenine-specific DNA methylase